jgi:hypothetical protein
MKKFFFLFAMLLSIHAFTQNINVESISTTYTGTPTVKFRVSWTGARTYRHNTKVWVFVDYQKVEGNAPSGAWTRAAVASTPTVSSSPASSATLVDGNNKGFWLNGADGNYSTTVTVPLSDVSAKFRWCAYATDYPPNVVILGNNSYTLHGSRPFVINGTTLPANQTTYSGTITSFTDATGAPGIFPAALGEKTNEMGCVAGLVENENSICATPASVGCTNNTLNLGTVTFTAGSEITIVGNGVSQIWSRPVTATGCQKTDFFTGDGCCGGTYNADCRTAPSYAGDFFGVCAVVRYAAQLCPPPWRVPSALDAKNLDKGLGGDGIANPNENFILTKYIGVWKGEWAGEARHQNLLVHPNELSAYGTHHMRANGSNPIMAFNGTFWGTDMRWFRTKGGNNGWLSDGMLLRCVR